MKRNIDQMTIQRAANIAQKLRNSTDLFIDQSGILSMDCWTFSQIVDSFSLILDNEQSTDFQVLPSNNRDIQSVECLQFIYDILQRVRNIRIWTKPGQPLPKEQTINVSSLRSLECLEVDRISVSQLRNVKSLRFNLKSLTLRNMEVDLQSVLCADSEQQESDFSWPKLKVLIVSHSLFTLDSSLQYLHALKILDLCYCGLSDVSSLINLPNIQHLNLSFNKLTSLPELRMEAANSLIVLSLRSNLLIDISSISNYSNLEHLDLAHNLLSLPESLKPLKHLPQLKNITLLGNPLTQNINHRIYALRILNAATFYCDELILDGEKVSGLERREIGMLAVNLLPSRGNIFNRISAQLKTAIDKRKTKVQRQQKDSLLRGVSEVEVHAVNETHECARPSPPPNLRRKRRRKNTRDVTIHDPSRGESVRDIGSFNNELTSYLRDDDFENISYPDQTPTLMKKDLTCDDMSHADQVLEEILQANGSRLILSPEKSSQSVVEPSMMTERKECQSEMSFFSSTNSSICKVSEQFSRQSSDITPITSEDEDESSDFGEATFIALKENKDIIIQISDTHFRERRVGNSHIICQWDLSWIESVEMLSSDPVKVKIVFQSLSRRLKPQICIYEMKSTEYLGLKRTLDPIMEQNVMKEICKSTMLCLKCEAEFSKPNAMVSEDGKDICPNCGGAVLINSHAESEQNTNTVITNTNTVQEDMIEKKSPGESGVVSSESKLHEETPSEHCSTTENESVCDTSSSIEVIMEFEPERHLRNDVRQPGLLHTIQNSDAPMQESTSSGSMAGSVCTTVDRTSNPNTPHRQLIFEPDKTKTEGCVALSNAHVSSTPVDSFISCSTSKDADYCSITSVHSEETMYHSIYESEGKGDRSDTSESIETLDKPPPDFTPWLESLSSSLTGLCWSWWEEVLCISEREKPQDKQIFYNMNEPTDVDHRIKLFFELIHFTEQDEHLIALTKCIVLTEEERKFSGLFVVSSHKIYLMEIVAQESDEHQSWMKEQLSLPLGDLSCIYNLLGMQGFAIGVADQQLLLVLSDSHWTTAIQTTLVDFLQKQQIPFTVEDCAHAQEELLRAMSLEICEDDDIAMCIRTFMIATYIQEDAIATSQFLVITDNYVMLFESDLFWYLPSGGQSRKLSCTAKEPMLNITAIEVFSDAFVSVIFDEGQLDSYRWNLHLASPSAIRQLIHAIRKPWTEMFDLELEVKCHSHFHLDNSSAVLASQ